MAKPNPKPTTSDSPVPAPSVPNVFGNGIVGSLLHRYLSKEALSAAKVLIAEADERFPGSEQASERHGWVYDNLIQFVENLDDKVTLIPYAGPILKAVVDSPEIDRKEQALCYLAIETVYQSLHLKS